MKPIIFQNMDYGILVGVSATMEDYYWVYLTPDMSLNCSSCVGGFDVIEENKIPKDLKQLMSNPNLMEIIYKKRYEYFMNTSEIEVLNY